MKHFLLLFLLFAFQGDSKPDYNLLIGSWMQKSYKDTPDTGVFSFSPDSTATLEMFKGETEELLARVQGKYSIRKKENTLTIDILGRPKVFTIVTLKQEVLTIKNITDNKEAQTFQRHDRKE